MGSASGPVCGISIPSRSRRPCSRQPWRRPTRVGSSPDTCLPDQGVGRSWSAKARAWRISPALSTKPGMHRSREPSSGATAKAWSVRASPCARLRIGDRLKAMVRVVKEAKQAAPCILLLDAKESFGSRNDPGDRYSAQARRWEHGSASLSSRCACAPTVTTRRSLCRTSREPDRGSRRKQRKTTPSSASPGNGRSGAL